MKIRILLLLASICLTVTAFAQADRTTVHMIGDSTMANKPVIPANPLSSAASVAKTPPAIRTCWARCHRSRPISPTTERSRCCLNKRTRVRGGTPHAADTTSELSAQSRQVLHFPDYRERSHLMVLQMHSAHPKSEGLLEQPRKLGGSLHGRKPFGADVRNTIPIRIRAIQCRFRRKIRPETIRCSESRPLA
jgi:hypothetical protein